MTAGAIFSRGPAMTAGWKRTVVLSEDYPCLLLNSHDKYAGMGYDSTGILTFRIGALTEDLFASGRAFLNVNADGHVILPSGTLRPEIDSEYAYRFLKANGDLAMQIRTLDQPMLGIGAPPAAFLYVVGTNYTDNADGVLFNIWSSVEDDGDRDNYGFAAQYTKHTIPVGVTEHGIRTAITGDATSVIDTFAGTLAKMIGIRGRAGFAHAAPGAKIGLAIGGYFAIRNEQVDVEMERACAIYLDNNATVGAIGERFDVYAASPLARNHFAGSIEVGAASAETGAIRLEAGAAITTRNVANDEDAALLKTTPADVTQLSGVTHAVADDGVLAIGADTLGLLSVIDRTAGYSAIYCVDGASAAVKVIDPANEFTATAGTTGKTNVYWSTTNARFELENKTGAAHDYRLVVMG